MARLTEDSDSDLPSLEELLRPSKARLPLGPAAVNHPTLSPRKRNPAHGKTPNFAIPGGSGDGGVTEKDGSPVKSTKIVEGSPVKNTTNSSGSPTKAPSSAVRSKLAGTGRQQRSLKLSHADSLLLPSVKDLSLKNSSPSKKQNVRESPKRRAKQNTTYTPVAELEVLDSSDDEVRVVDTRRKNCCDDEAEEEYIEPKDLRRQEDDAFVDSFKSLKLQKPSLTSPRKKQLEIVDLTISPTKEDSSDTRKRSPMKETVKSGARNSSTSFPSDTENLGSILRFSPPLHKSPSKRPPISPPRGRPQTPPTSPTKSRLVSPSKRPPTIPAPPPKHHRPSLDTFWDQDQINTWTDTYSPKKILASPRKPRSYSLDSSDSESPLNSPTSSPRKATAAENGSPSKKAAAAAAKKEFDARKQGLAEAFFTQLDQRLTKGEIERLAASADGVKIVWSNKLNSTAGRANWRREAIKRVVDPSLVTSASVSTASTTTTTTTAPPTITYRHVASIELASKVITSPPRLYNVLAHEYCHLANFMLSRVLNNPHGASFRSWAAKATRAFGDSHGVEVTTKHEYVIEYHFLWVCGVGGGGGGGGGLGGREMSGCGTEYARHSKSIDPTRHTCGKCRGRLVQVRPKPRSTATTTTTTTTSSSTTASKTHARGNATGESSDGGAGKGGGTAYAQFVKQQFQAVRSGLPPGSPVKDVMREVGVRYRAGKAIDTAAVKQGKKDKTGGVVETIEIVDEVDDSVMEEGEGGEGADERGEEEEEDGDVDDVARVLDFVTIDE